MQQTLENPMITGQATPRVFADSEEFGTNTAARLVHEVGEEIEYALEEAKDRLAMYQRMAKEMDGEKRQMALNCEFECKKSVKVLRELLEYAKETKEYAL